MRGGSSVFPTKEVFQLGDLNYELAYGSRIIELPFSIFLRDFQLERYPGGQSPASYASEVTVIDHQTGKQFDHRIYMNNVLDYGGYRFFFNQTMNRMKWAPFFL
ncbi:MAG: cytochrome c biogenesis protein ResB [Crocinitomicaceae bacterium]|nr:cytochrome c biogenesis protein ResB [Crocinitomicaceae bacterium]